MSLFPFTPRTTFGINASFKLETVIERTEIGGEVRSVMRPHMLRSLSLPYALFNSEAQEARSFFEHLEGEEVRLPDWTSGAEIENESGQLKGFEEIDFRAFSVFVVGLNDTTGKEYELTAYDATSGVIKTAEPLNLEGEKSWMVYPIRKGRLSSKPSFSYENDNSVTFSLNFIETIASRNESFDWLTSEPLNQYQGRYILDYFRKEESESWEDSTKWTQKGYGQETFYTKEDESKRKFSVSVTQGSRALTYALIRLFDTVKGRAQGFWLSSERCNYQLTKDAKKGETEIEITDNGLLADSIKRVGYSHIMIRTCTGDHITEIASIGENEGVSFLSLSDALTVDAKADDVAISLLNYVRFGSDELKVNFFGSKVSTTKLTFIELPKEYSFPSVPVTDVWLYEFSGFFSAKYTSYGETVDSEWIPFDIDHSNYSLRKQSLDSSCTVSMGISDPEHPLNIFQEGYPLEDTFVKIYRYNPATGFDLFYSSIVNDIDYGEDNNITLKLGSRYSIAKAEIPTAQIEPRCPLRFGGNACGYTPLTESHEITGLPNRYEIEIASFNGGDRFLDGSIMIGSEMRTITFVEDGRVSVASPFILAVQGQQATIKQGCNKSLATCVGYNNNVNFGGIPFVPATNPQLEALAIDSSIPSGGKK